MVVVIAALLLIPIMAAAVRAMVPPPPSPRKGTASWARRAGNARSDLWPATHRTAAGNDGAAERIPCATD